jgi:predicted transglutaminase-like cysteine proteinase
MAAGAFTLLLVACPADADQRAALLGEREIHSANVARFKNWTDVLARWQRERSAAGQCEASTPAAGCAPREWRELIQELRGLPRRTILERLNIAVNRHPYVPSIDNWGVVSHWETPFEFFRRNGQCQDYAIAKFMLLRDLGFANDELRIVVLRDVERGLDHAVLVVYLDGQSLMLDSLGDHVVPTASVAAYRAYYSINETGWWLHLPNPMAERRPMLRQVTAE